MECLERSFDKQVIVVANRTIISPGAKSHPSQMRPRSRCLTVVHKEILNDVVFPSTITGRSLRLGADGRKSEKVMLDPLDKDDIDSKVDAIVHCYHKLSTTRRLLHLMPLTKTWFAFLKSQRWHQVRNLTKMDLSKGREVRIVGDLQRRVEALVIWRHTK